MCIITDITYVHDLTVLVKHLTVKPATCGAYGKINTKKTIQINIKDTEKFFEVSFGLFCNSKRNIVKGQCAHNRCFTFLFDNPVIKFYIYYDYNIKVIYFNIKNTKCVFLYFYCLLEIIKKYKLYIS